MHALIGDVCGRGPAEAALGVCLRVAWRTLVLAGRPAEEILSTLSELLEHERQDDTMFATLCMTSVHPDRTTGWIRMAGHLPPLVLSHGGVAELPTRPRGAKTRKPMTELDDPRVIDVLLVEDDDGDVLMTREAFEYYRIRNRLHVVGDGEQALQFLHRTGPYEDAPRPGLILLDVNLPRRSGLEVLAELKQDDELLMIPVIMLTTSRAEEDIVRSYSLHANAFVSKPVDFEHFIDAVRQIDTFFMTLVRLPA